MINFSKIILFVILTILAPVFLAGCSSPDKSYFKRVQYVSRNTYCTMHFSEQLQRNDVQVAYHTKIIQLALKANELFNLNSANFTDKAHETLDSIASLLRCCDIEDMQITSFMHYPIRDEKLVALASARASHVKGYLWSQNVNASIVYATGEVLTKMVSGGDDGTDYLFITFRKVY